MYLLWWLYFWSKLGDSNLNCWGLIARTRPKWSKIRLSSEIWPSMSMLITPTPSPTPQTIGILTKVLYIFGRNLVILAWTRHKSTQTQATTISEGQNWHRMKVGREPQPNTTNPNFCIIPGCIVLYAVARNYHEYPTLSNVAMYVLLSDTGCNGRTFLIIILSCNMVDLSKLQYHRLHITWWNMTRYQIHYVSKKAETLLRQWTDERHSILRSWAWFAWFMGRYFAFASWTSYQILTIAGCAFAGNAGNVFPVTAG